jgi:hypothetical protein
MEERALSTITVFPSNKTEIAMYSRKLKSEILASNDDPLEILKQLKIVESVIADILKDTDIERHFLAEAYKYVEKTFDHKGVKFTIGEVGVKYDFSECGDPGYFDLVKQSEEIKEKLKAREEFLKTIPDEGTVDPGTGVFINKATKSSKSKVTVRL